MNEKTLGAGTRVTTTVGKYAGQFGTVQEGNRGTVTNTEHENYGRAFVSVRWDPTPEIPWGETFRPFVDELTVVEDAKPSTDDAVEAWQAANFDDFAVGDRVRFQTIDNGFGGSGDFIMRTGKVTAVTPRTLRVECGPNPFGSRAVLSRANWYHRYPQKAVPATCKHGNAPRRDVTGDPIAACANADGRTEWGAFNAEGCTYAYDCAVDVANNSARQNEEAEATPDDPESAWGEMCRDHRDQEQPKDGCEECFADEPEDADEEDGDGEV